MAPVSYKMPSCGPCCGPSESATSFNSLLLQMFTLSGSTPLGASLEHFSSQMTFCDCNREEAVRFLEMALSLDECFASYHKCVSIGTDRQIDSSKPVSTWRNKTTFGKRSSSCGPFSEMTVLNSKAIVDLMFRSLDVFQQRKTKRLFNLGKISIRH